MKSKLAGRLSLQDMISAQLETAREKLAASEPESEKVKKLVEYEKSYHGHVPSPEEEMEEKKKARKAGAKAEKAAEEAEKKASADDVEKLASALDYVGEMLKEADAIENGGEYKGGGEQIPTASPVGGTQPYKKDASKRWAALLSTPPEKASDAPAATAMMTNEGKAPGGAPFPAKGVLKTAAKGEEESEAERKRLEKGHRRAGAAIGGVAGAIHGAEGAYGRFTGREVAPGRFRGIHTRGHGRPGAGAIGGALGGAAVGYVGGHIRNAMANAMSSKEKKSSAAVGYILDKIAEYKGGGETLDDQAAPVPANAGRELIQSNQALIDYTKRQAKSPRKAELAQVLVEPAMTATTDSKVNENLRNAPQAGVKIAAAKALLQKIAEEGCSCNGKKECRYCKMQAVLEKKKEEKKSE